MSTGWLVLLLLLGAVYRPAWSRESGVCSSVDVRNNASNLHAALRGCRVVEGSVHIVLIDQANDTDYDNLSFPELREISNYLLLYRVSGLRSLAQLFPNLAVIRGFSLFDGYALVVYEMFGLQDVALPSLTLIAHGGVLIEKNPALCFVQTVIWSNIVLDQNLGKNGLRLREGHFTLCMDKCPAKCGMSGCWNDQYCQHPLCPPQCIDRGCFSPLAELEGEEKALGLQSDGSDGPMLCCHEQCIEGCWGPDADQCYACRYAWLGQKCVAKCPEGFFVFYNSRCISQNECLYMGMTIEPDPQKESSAFVLSKQWRIFNGSCLPECPPGYEEYLVPNDRTPRCEPCREEGCRRVCMGSKVDNIESAKNFKGCTHINGSLEIQINGGKDVSQELEENLGSIEEIDGYLKVTRSFSLISLNFLKKLRAIHGQELDKNRYILIVMHNQNLQELWDWEEQGNHTTFYLGNGSLSFHSNPKLCLWYIERLQALVGANNFTEQEVSSMSNGDEVACDVVIPHAQLVVVLQAHVVVKRDTSVILGWEVFSEPNHNNSLIGYLIYSIEAPVENVTAYDGRDVCGDNDWRVDYVPSMSAGDHGEESMPHDQHSGDIGHPGEVNQIITRLKPNTKYAYYVKTYSLASAKRQGGQSKIQYFTTLPSRPSPPLNLRASSHDHSEMLIQWRKPLNPNGDLSHYLVVGHWIPDDQEFLQLRDYCLNPMTTDDGNSPKHIIALKPNSHLACHPPKFQLLKSHNVSPLSEECQAKCGQTQENDQLDSNFDDCFTKYLHELPYLVNTSNPQEEDMFPPEESNPKQKNYSRDPVEGNNVTVAGVLHEFAFTVPASLNSVLARPLRHFGLYSIQVWACRQPHPDEAIETERCSSASHVSLRTAALRSADALGVVNSTLLEPSGVRLYWSPPSRPNGLVLAFHVEWRREGQGSYRSQLECLTLQNYEAAGGVYILGNLPAGRHSVRVRATTLAGDGPFSERTSFVLPSPPENNKYGLTVSILVVSLLLLIVISVFSLFFWKQKKHKMESEDMCLIASVNPDYVSANYTEDEWELVRDRVTLLRELGQGSFGMVYEGELCPEGSGTSIPCAVKTMNESASCRERLQFLHEASVMKAFQAHHVVRLLGVVSRGQPTLVVMELMARGDLKTYLRSDREASEPSPKRLLHMAAQIADGMLYLSTKKFVHRDLAARNCMVSEDLTVKIGDFGMTRDIYETDYYRKGSKGLLPVRWMAPESLQDGVFTSSSDVWSFGVVLWEMATHAEQPYQGLSNEQVLQRILTGGSLSPPSDCPDVMARLMVKCWERAPSGRPGFAWLLERLLPHVPPDFSMYSFYHTREHETAGPPPQTRPPPLSNGYNVTYLA